MRQALLASAATAAVGLLAAGPVRAAGVELHLGGYYHAAVGGIAGERFSRSSQVAGDDPRDHAVKQNVDVVFLGEGSLDNGIAVGSYVELRAQTQRDQIKKVYAYVKGGFGTLQVGDQDDALATLCYTVPSASKVFGADSPSSAGFNFSNAGVAGYGATNGTCYGIDNKSTRLAYFSPDFGGFQFALSYTPDNTEDTRNTLDGFGTRSDGDAGQNSENLSVAVKLAETLGGVGLIVGGGQTWSFDKELDPNDAGKARDANGYLQATYSGLTVGAAVEYRENLLEDGADQLVFGAGATYEWGRWIVGLGWTRGDYENAVGANGVGPFDATHDDFALTLSGKLAEGVSVDGLVEYSHYDSDEADGPDYEGIGVAVGTAIRF